MKHILKWYCFCISLIYILACSDNGETTHYHIFVDITDSTNRNIKLPVNDLLNYAGLNTKDGGYNGIKANIYTINNLSNAKNLKINPMPIGNSFDNPLTRIKLIKGFASELDNSFSQSISTSNWQKNQSRIYVNLCQEFQNIVKGRTQNEREIVIIYSDMLENSNLFSFYKTSDQQKLATWNKDIKQAETELSKLADCSFPDLSNIEVYIISERKETNNSLIDSSQSFWKRFFEYKNCKIKFDADLSLEP